jgi:hypothetical protein
MSKLPRDPFADLIDDFDGGKPIPPSAAPDREGDFADAHEDSDAFPYVPASEKTFRETCHKCNGRGRFVGYSGRIFGDCFACKGVGYKTFKTSPDKRAKGRDHARAAQARKVASIADAAAAFRLANPEACNWLAAAAARGFEWAQDVNAKLDQYGSLTEGQLAAADRLMARDRERAAERASAAKIRVESAPVVAVDRMMAAFDAALGKGIKRPTMRFEAFTASLAPATGKNPGAVYLKDGEAYLGKIAGGKFLASRDASEAQKAAILTAMADPLAAAVAYGRRTGSCSICGRELTDPVSIERGIGPICVERFGF